MSTENDWVSTAPATDNIPASACPSGTSSPSAGTGFSHQKLASIQASLISPLMRYSQPRQLCGYPMRWAFTSSM